MSDDRDRAGADLDIFEGLGKKSEKATPPPPGSSSHLGGGATRPRPDPKKTLLGIPGPGSPSGTMNAVSPASRPSSSRQPASGQHKTTSKPPPSRGSLPSIPGTRSEPPPPAEARPKQRTPSSVDSEWDDDHDTHVYKEARERAEAAKNEPRPSSRDGALPPATPKQGGGLEAFLNARDRSDDTVDEASSEAREAAPAPAASSKEAMSAPADSPSLADAFGNLGKSDTSNGAPRSGSMRSAPPPPPTSAMRTPAMAGAIPPPPPPPGSVGPGLTPSGQIGAPPQMNTLQSAQSPMGPHGSTPPPPMTAQMTPSYPPMMAHRALENTFVTQKASSRAPIFVALLTVMAIAAIAVFLLMPRTGSLVVNVADTKGTAVQGLEVTVDGTKRCESAPCIVRELAAGVHEVKVAAKGYEQPAPRAVTVESRKDTPTDFQLATVKPSAGTGFKAASPGTGVKVQVDGKEIGSLPQEVKDLEPGEHKLKFSGDRYVALEKTVVVGKDEMVDVGNVALKVQKGKATIQLSTPGAKVYLVSGTNRKEVPQFPMAIEFDTAEKWDIVAVKDGFDEYRERIGFDDGQPEKTFNVTLMPKGSKTGAVGAAGPGALPSPTPRVAMAPKDPSEHTSAGGGGETALKINSLPASSVVLDGKPIGVTPQAHVPVSPGSHTIMFVNAEQSLKKTITVEVKAGETKAAFAKLRE